MKPRTASLSPAVLPGPCPKCGGQVVLRPRDGRLQARCEGSGCLFAFDVDKRGRPAAPCPACGTGRLKTTPKGRVCADCGRWDNSPQLGGRAGKELCPRCKSGRLAIIKGEYGHFAGCSDLACGLTYTCDETGRPEGGHCRACRGPVRKTRSGSRICVVCETWQTPKPLDRSQANALRPPEAPCPACGATMRQVWTRRQRWLHRCDACLRWVDSNVATVPEP